MEWPYLGACSLTRGDVLQQLMDKNVSEDDDNKRTSLQEAGLLPDVHCSWEFEVLGRLLLLWRSSCSSKLLSRAGNGTLYFLDCDEKKVDF